ncbi:MAG: NfeD family protein [Opitutales bacterium]
MNTIILLLILALGLCFIEIFAPGGIFALIGGVFVIIAAILGFQEYGPRVGIWILVGGAAVGTTLFFLEMKLILGTGFGSKRFAHREANEDRTGFIDSEALVGEPGETVTRMVPGGKVKVGDQVYPAISLDGYLPQGTPVVVRQADPSVIRISQANPS